MTRGEIWWCEHPTAGRRPFLILSRAEAVPVLAAVLAVPATTTVRGIPTEVPLGRADGMPRDCVLSVDNVATIRKSHCVERITKLSPEKMSAVCDALRFATAC